MLHRIGDLTCCGNSLPARDVREPGVRQADCGREWSGVLGGLRAIHVVLLFYPFSSIKPGQGVQRASAWVGWCPTKTRVPFLPSSTLFALKS